MYILFYPLKFPSTPVLILFKVLQHHNNLLWPRAGLEPAFIHRYRDYLQTCAYFLIQHLAARDTVSPPVGLCILHTPLRLGRLFHSPTRSYGREDRTRTCDPWFGLYIRFELMILPLLYRLTNFSAYWLTVTKTSVLANWTTSRNFLTNSNPYGYGMLLFFHFNFLFVAHSRIELLFQEWKSCGLTVSRVRHE